MSDDQKKPKKDDGLLEDLKKQAEEYKNKYLRALADYQNFEKRVSQEKEEIKKQADKNMLLKLLPFLDDLDKAEVFIKDPGLKMVKDSFYKLLKREGIEEMDLLGREYDPHLAEAVDVIPGKQDNIIVEVLRRGFKHNGQILRVAQVKVSKKVVSSV